MDISVIASVDVPGVAGVDVSDAAGVDVSGRAGVDVCSTADENVSGTVGVEVPGVVDVDVSDATGEDVSSTADGNVSGTTAGAEVISAPLSVPWKCKHIVKYVKEEAVLTILATLNRQPLREEREEKEDLQNPVKMHHGIQRG